MPRGLPALPYRPLLVLLPGLLLVLAACGDKMNTQQGRLITAEAPYEYLPRPHDCPENWSFVSQSIEDNAACIVNYKRTIAADDPDYLTIRVTLWADLDSAIAQYQLSRTRLMQYRDTFIQTVAGLGERSATLTVDPKRILFQRANVVIEVEAERLGESAIIFAQIIDDRLVDALEHGPEDHPGRPVDREAQPSPP